MTRATLRAECAAGTSIPEQLETMILAVQQHGYSRGAFGTAYRLANGSIHVNVGSTVYTARTTETGWRIHGPECIGAAHDLLDACRLATKGA